MNALIVGISAFGFTGCLMFIVLFHIVSGGSWRRNQTSVWLILSRINLGLIFALIVLNRIFGDWPGRQLMILGLVALFALQTFWPTYLLIVAERNARHDEHLKDRSRTEMENDLR